MAHEKITRQTLPVNKLPLNNRYIAEYHGVGNYTVNRVEDHYVKSAIMAIDGMIDLGFEALCLVIHSHMILRRDIDPDHLRGFMHQFSELADRKEKE